MMYSDTARRRLLVSGIFALVGAAMWAYKSIVILLTGDQPDYWFELALIWFGVSILLLAAALRRRVRRSRNSPIADSPPAAPDKRISSCR